MFTLRISNSFKSDYQKLVGQDAILSKRVKKALLLLQSNPLHPSLNSHKVNTRNYGLKWSSWVSGDIRIIWDYDPSQETVKVLQVYTIGTHSGKHKVYN